MLNTIVIIVILLIVWIISCILLYKLWQSEVKAKEQAEARFNQERATWTSERSKLVTTFLDDHRKLVNLELYKQNLPTLDTDIEPKPLEEKKDVDLNDLDAVKKELSKFDDGNDVKYSMNPLEHRRQLADAEFALESKK